MKHHLLRIVFSLLLVAPAYPSSLTFTLDQPLQNGAPGPVPIIFTGTLTDTDIIADTLDPQYELDMNDISVTFSPADGNLTLDPTGDPVSSPNQFFTTTVNGNLFASGDPGSDTYTGPIFEVFINPAAAAGLYLGSIDILGGFSDRGATDTMATATFEINVTPEPGVVGLTLTGLLVLFSIQAIGVRRHER
jgi:hypothetical protein